MVFYVIFGIVLTSILTSFATWEYMWEGEYLGKWASIVTMGSLVMAPGIYFWKKRQDAVDEVHVHQRTYTRN